MLLKFILILAMVESSMDPQAVGDKGKAVGLLQIHTIMVDDVNRIIGFEKFSYTDRLDYKKSIQMAVLYLRHYEPEMGLEAMARAWNGGPNWRKKKKRTDGYWQKVLKRLEKNEQFHRQ